MAAVIVSISDGAAARCLLQMTGNSKTLGNSDGT
jgi:hypothetical protein